MVSKVHESKSETQQQIDDGKIFVRPKSTYVSNFQKYLINDRTFDRQYSTFYISRLKITSSNIQEQARKKWGKDIPIKQLCDIEGSERVVVIGTIFKHMELHPSILREISEEHNLIPQPVCEEFTKENDYLILEDDLQRVILCGEIEPHLHVTGINIAVYGFTEEHGKFYVEDYLYATLSEPISYPLFYENKYVLLVSGFGLGDPNVLFPLQLLADFVTGQLGEESDQEKNSHIVRIIIAGNSIGRSSQNFFSKTKILTRKSKAATIEGVKVLDDFLSQLVSSVDVDVMPGEFDPANHLMPQQPLHPCMFPKSAIYSTFHVVTNPYDCVIDGVRFVGSSGQNIKDIQSYSRLTNPLDVIEKTLDWSHMMPTAPDTLNCYPFLGEDPFILSECPHVYFAGNMTQYASKHYKNKTNSLMISVPKFQNSFCAVMVNLKTLEAEPVMFETVLQ